MHKVKIFGAGSIGNHLANASRRLGWDVVLCDLDPAALERTRNEIYPARYGSWDPAIELHHADDAPRGGFDLIVVGTPPDAHLPVALRALEEEPRALLVEKPLCTPAAKGPKGLEAAAELQRRAAEAGVAVHVGYDHVVGRAARSGLAAAQRLSGLETLDVEFREHWGGIFGAHPWLAGPEDTYLGFWERGGGASGEHSHAINLWQFLAHGLGAGRVVEVTASLEYVRDGVVDYDALCLLNLRTERGLLGRVVQDVVTRPARKWARVQAHDGFAELGIGAEPGVDAVRWQVGDEQPGSERIEKTRPDDFIAELEHIRPTLTGEAPGEALSLARGIETMHVVAAAHRSALEGRTVRIDHEAHPSDALRVA
ncbi:MAG: Gfo/Idh/MocA family oxidoreductase [Myxococcota bacterium]|nr:Gfo/Idh/MocA family oxidoreductase [Myxococcota bacterium]